MIIINIKVDADDTNTKKPQVFKADIEIYQDRDKIGSSPIQHKNFRKLMQAALSLAQSEAKHYRMLGYKPKIQVDWEQYTFVKEDGEFSSDAGLTFKEFLRMFDEGLNMSKAKNLARMLEGSGPDSKGYTDSYAGWRSIIKRSADEIVTNFGRISKALESGEEKDVQRALGYMHRLLDELTKNVGGLKKVNKQLLADVSKPDIKGSDFWK